MNLTKKLKDWYTENCKALYRKSRLKYDGKTACVHGPENSVLRYHFFQVDQNSINVNWKKCQLTFFFPFGISSPEIVENPTM